MLRRLIRAAGVVALTLMPGGVLLAAAASWRTCYGRRARSRMRFSLIAWGGFLLLLLPTLVLTDPNASKTVLLEALLGLGATAALCFRQEDLVAGFISALLVMAVAGSAENLLVTGWRPSLSDAVQVRGISPRGLVDEIRGAGAHESGFLELKRPPGSTNVLNITVQSRAGRGTQDWDFIRSPAVLSVVPMEGGHGVRISTSDRGDPYLVRRYPIDAPHGYASYRAQLRLRIVSPNPACGEIFVGSRGGVVGTHQNVCLTASWTSYEISFAPRQEGLHAIDVVVSGFQNATYELDRLILQESAQPASKSWETLKGFPAGGWLVTSASSRSDDRLMHSLPLRAVWTPSSFSVPVPPAATSIRIGAYIDEGTSMQLRHLEAIDSSGRRWRPIPPTRRASLWFPSPNVVGQSAVISTIVAMSAAGSFGASTLALLLGSLVVGLSGSRAAATILVLAGLAHLLLRSRNTPSGRGRISSRFYLVAIALAALAMVFVFRGVSSRPGSTPEVTRPAIWQAAISAIQTYPLSGLAGHHVSFRDWFAAQHVGLAQTVTHAHNFWLQLGAQFGVLGLVASLWLTASMFAYALRQKRPGPLLLLVGSATLLSLVDYTLFSYGVVLPLIAGLTSLAEDHATDA